MTAINNMKGLMSISLRPVITAIQVWFVDMQISKVDSSMEYLDKSIKNDTAARDVLENDRINLINRKRNLISGIRRLR